MSTITSTLAKFVLEPLWFSILFVLVRALVCALVALI